MITLNSLWLQIEEILEDTSSIQERLFFECKKSANTLPKDFWLSYSAFSNTQGGIIFLGISEQNQVFSISGVSNTQKLLDDMFSQMRGGQKISINNLSNDDIKIIQKEINNILVDVIAIRVKKADNSDIPVHLNNDPRLSYVRLHTGDHKLNANELKNYLSGYTKNNQDSKVIPNTGIDEINQHTLQKYRQFLKNYNPTSPLLVLDDLLLLKKINAYARNLDTGQEGLTYAGLLVFGQLHIIRQLLPHYFLDYQDIQGDERYSSRFTCDDLEDGNLFEFYLKTSALLFDIAKNSHFKLNNLTRKEENEITEALREALVNFFTHADYFNDQISLKIVKTSNRLTFENPGSMLVSIEQAINGLKSTCRNSLIHNIFRIAGLCERQGKGIEKIFTNWIRELLTTPELLTNHLSTHLALTLQDGATLSAIRKLQTEFGEEFSQERTLYKNILIYAVLNDGWINHASLTENMGNSFTGREITLALPQLAKKCWLIGKGDGKKKYYILPWIKEVDIADIYTSGSVRLRTKANAQANAQANALANAQANNLTESRQVKFIWRDNEGRIQNTLGKVVDNLKELNPEYLQELRNIVNPRFYSLKKKRPEQVKELLLVLCEDQYVSKAALADLLGMTISALGRHITLLVEERLLIPAFPQQPTHKDQAYKAA